MTKESERDAGSNKASKIPSTLSHDHKNFLTHSLYSSFSFIFPLYLPSHIHSLRAPDRMEWNVLRRKKKQRNPVYQHENQSKSSQVSLNFFLLSSDAIFNAFHIDEVLAAADTRACSVLDTLRVPWLEIDSGGLELASHTLAFFVLEKISLF